MLEDGDNSSSGVSSDQETTIGASIDYNGRIGHEHNSQTLPSMKGQQRQQAGKYIEEILKEIYYTDNSIHLHFTHLLLFNYIYSVIPLFCPL